MWKVKNKKEEIEPLAETDVESEVDLDQEKAELEARIKQLEQRKVQAPQQRVPVQKIPTSTDIDKNEVADIIIGHLNRVASLVEVLRRS